MYSRGIPFSTTSLPVQPETQTSALSLNVWKYDSTKALLLPTTHNVYFLHQPNPQTLSHPPNDPFIFHTHLQLICMHLSRHFHLSLFLFPYIHLKILLPPSLPPSLMDVSHIRLFLCAYRSPTCLHKQITIPSWDVYELYLKIADHSKITLSFIFICLPY